MGPLTVEDWQILGLTLKVALVATAAILPIGVLMALGLARWRGPGRGVVETVLALPLVVRSARTSFEEIDPRLAGVARTLGRGPLYVFARVTLPLAGRGIAAGALLAFSRALGEFGATILIAGSIPGETRTLALAIFHRSETGHDADGLRLVAATVIIAFAAVWTTELLLRRRNGDTIHPSKAWK